MPNPPQDSNTVSNMIGVELDAYDFKTTDPSAAPIDLAELKLWPPRQGERGRIFPIWPELRFADETILFNGWRITVHLIRAELAADFNGCAAAPGTRYGDLPLPATVEAIETEIGEKDVSRSGELSAEMRSGVTKGLWANVKASVAGTARIRSKTETKRKSQIVQRRVATLPNDRWEIVEPRGRLRGPYLVAPAADKAADNPLCRVIADSDTLVITLSLEVRPHDLDPDITRQDGIKWLSLGKWEKPNKNAIAKLLFAKACMVRFGPAGDERVVIARTVLRGNRRKATEGLSSDSSK